MASQASLPLPIGLRLWRAFTAIASPFASVLLARRAVQGKEDHGRLPERLGVAQIPRPAGRLVWIHGASVGESLAALPLIEKLQAQGNAVLVTSGTVTSAKILGQRLPKGAIHQFVPLDIPGAVTRFLDHWKPDAGLFVESDLWPNLVLAASARGMKLALVNARISEHSARGWKRAPKSARRLIGAFDAVLAQDDEIAARFIGMGARGVLVVGSLKADAPPLSYDGPALEALKQQIGTRPLLIAAQTHPGEDETVLPAHDILRQTYPDLLTILIPRHPERGPALAELCGARKVAQRAAGEMIGAETQVYIADTLGELGLFYRLAPFCFIGGTLVALGGHNPLEPAILKCAIMAGPYRSSAANAYAAIIKAQGFGDVISSADIARRANRLLSDPQKAAAAGEAAAAGAATQAGAVAKTIAVLDGLYARA